MGCAKVSWVGLSRFESLVTSKNNHVRHSYNSTKTFLLKNVTIAQQNIRQPNTSRLNPTQTQIIVIIT